MSIEMLQKIVDSGTKLTPMMDQYYSIKKSYPDILLLYRMGDFYELFFDDAVEASKILNITLTHRGKVKDFPIPMAGIPHHSANSYIDRITALGMKAAICEQIEDPKMATGIVKRAVTQIVSPGIPYDLEKIDGLEHRYIGSAIHYNGFYYLISIDFTTGEFIGHKFSDEQEFLAKLKLINFREFIQSMGQWDEHPQIKEFFEKTDILVTYLSLEYFTPKHTNIYTEKLIPSFKRDTVITENSAILAPIGALAYYICSTQAIEDFYHIKPFRMQSEQGMMKVSMPTLIGLEIIPRNREQYKNSLLGFFDKTKTCMGSRKLRSVFSSPLADKQAISERQDVIQYLIDEQEVLEKITTSLGEVRDLERILAKVSAKKVTSSDLINLARAIDITNQLQTSIEQIPTNIIGKLDKNESSTLNKIFTNITKTINDEIGASLEKGNLIKEGCSKERDKLANLSQNRAHELLELEEKYREETGIPKLRVKSNNLAGYFIEVSKTHSSKVPSSFDRRQTLVNSERYITKELKEFEKEITHAKERLEQLEKQLFQELVKEVASNSQIILKMANIIAHLDVFSCFAKIAYLEEFSRPEIQKNKKVLSVNGGWHPLIKAIIKEQFVPHNLHLDEKEYFGLITGPNMAGKTTVMREIAIIQFLAQIGSFVPANSAKLGLCDYLFSRLGASDDIQSGHSTFMVEMSETAEILRHATCKSLIILDEVGRGTSTYDGLSIAWALVEHFIKKTKALALFATHYHELIELASETDGAKNLTVETKSNQGEVEFLYRLIEQGASQSYGIYVAKLAGIPTSVLGRSQELLQSFETNKGEELEIQPTQLSLLDEENSADTIPQYLTKIEEDLADVDVMNMTPLMAINKLHDLKNILSTCQQT